MAILNSGIRIQGNLRPGIFLLILVFSCWVCCCAPLHAMRQTWQQRGPSPISGGQVEGMNNPQILGAVHAIAAHPTDPNILFVGTTNGGIWNSTNATSNTPNWNNLTANESSLSIGALEFDPIDQQNRTLVAGIGRTSSLAGFGSALTGLLKTTDAGISWQRITGEGVLNDLNISGVAARGSTIVVSVDRVEDGSGKQPGIWRSIDSGSNFERVLIASGLPNGPSFDLVGDIENPTILYANAGRSGLYQSKNTGKTWTKVSNNAMDQEMSDMTGCEIAAGTDGNLYVAIVTFQNHPSNDPQLVGDRLSTVFHSSNSGQSWTDLGSPKTTEDSGIEFGLHPGGQGNLHLAIAIDPANNSIFYVGGDRQPHFREGFQNANTSFPNSIGASDYSARAFRGNASSSSNRWVHLTHRQSPSGGGTASNSSPHADVREIKFGADNQLLLGCDGGIYRRDQPQSSSGDWTSINGDLNVTEFHAVAWDSISDVIIGGAQDNGTADSRIATEIWDSVGGGDGGVTLVDDTEATNSTRYSSAQNLSGLRRRRFDAAGQQVGSTQLAQRRVVNALGQPLFLPNGAPFLIPGQFYTPLALNPVDTDRILFGGRDTIYESDDQGDTAKRLTAQGGALVRVNNRLGLDCLSYGADDNEDAFYAGSDANVFIRTAAPPQRMQRSATYPGGNVQALVMAPGEFETAFVADEDQVFRTDDAGLQWTDISNNLGDLSVGTILTIAYRPASDQVIIGGHSGIASATGPNFDNWTVLGNGLPNAPVYHLEFDANDDLLLAGTLGRGAWTIEF